MGWAVGPWYLKSPESLQELCLSKHVVSCVKLSVVRALDRLSRLPSLELLPGLTVRGDMMSLQDLPKDITAGQVDDALLRSLTRYLSSLSLTVRVLDGGVVQRIREMGEALTRTGQAEESSATGRRRRTGSTMMMAGMMSGGTMMALGMSAIAAMAGKALMTALLSLMLSAMSAMRGSGGGADGKTTYEVIHAAHDIKHRSIEAMEADTSASYPYFMHKPASRRNILIPLSGR
ncbi:hypothetical protein J6590_000850 [Homalodisca vitripennis]|nr:hypothetical protein J6590_000850 [Homalodisca vitripennis]